MPALKLLLTFLHIRTAALDDEMIKDRILMQGVLDDMQVELVGRLRLLSGEQFFLKLDEVTAQAVDAEIAGGFGEIAFVAVGDEFQNVSEIVDGIVDRRRREEEDLLLPAAGLVQIFLKHAVTGRLALALAFDAGVAEVMSFVDEHHVGIPQRAADVPPPLARLALQIGVVVSDEVDERTIEVRQVLLDHRFPNILARGFRREEDYPFALVHDKSFDEHEADERFTKPHAVAQKRTAVASGDADEVFVSVALVFRQPFENDGSVGVPLVGGEFVAAKKTRAEP